MLILTLCSTHCCVIRCPEVPTHLVSLLIVLFLDFFLCFSLLPSKIKPGNTSEVWDTSDPQVKVGIHNLFQSGDSDPWRSYSICCLCNNVSVFISKRARMGFLLGEMHPEVLPLSAWIRRLWGMTTMTSLISMLHSKRPWGTGSHNSLVSNFKLIYKEIANQRVIREATVKRLLLIWSIGLEAYFWVNASVYQRKFPLFKKLRER